MASDLERLLRAVRAITRVAKQYRNEDVVEALLKYATLRDREDVAFAGTFLTGLWESYRQADEEAGPHCCECGDHLRDRNDGNADGIIRSDARYCSAACRQKAYRKRVAANRIKGGTKRHVSADRDASQECYTRIAVTPVERIST